MTADPHAPPVVDQGAALVDRRGRMYLPSFVRATPWLAIGTPPIETLVVLDEPGQALLHPWDPEAQPILNRKKELAENTSNDPSATLELLMIEDRYKQMVISKEYRPTWSDEILLHLGIIDHLPIHVYVERVADSLQIISQDYRNSRIPSYVRRLAGLP